jgi:fatty acid desaturase
MQPVETTQAIAESGTPLDGIPNRLAPPEAVRALSALNPWVSSAHIAGEWLAIAGAVALCTHFWHPALYAVAVLFIGARQHALGILMHDAAHYRLFADKRLNDAVANLFLAWPILYAMAGYRRNHLAHHAHLNTEADPNWARKTDAEWDFPQPASRMAWALAKEGLGLNLARRFRVLGEHAKQSGGKAWARYAFYGVVVGLVAFQGWWAPFLLYWVVPLATWLQVVLRVREIADHSGTANTHDLNRTRTVYLAWWERLFVASKHINYHIEHHLYPGVPFYRLPKLHALLLEHPTYRAEAHRTHGYWAVLRECIRR